MSIAQRLRDLSIQRASGIRVADAKVNHTMDPLLEAASGCREVVVLGPSTPLVPRAFDDTPVTVLSGVVVTDPSRALEVVWLVAAGRGSCGSARER